jgi:homoserine acetyltransferase
MSEMDPAASWPNYQEDDFLIKDYRFASGEVLPELRLHYRTMGMPRRDAAGQIVNGVLLLQGNTGTGANWLRPSLADELYGPGQPLDATNASSSCRTRSAAAGRRSLPTGCGGISRITATATWSRAATAC